MTMASFKVLSYCVTGRLKRGTETRFVQSVTQLRVELLTTRMYFSQKCYLLSQCAEWAILYDVQRFVYWLIISRLAATTHLGRVKVKLSHWGYTGQWLSSSTQCLISVFLYMWVVKFMSLSALLPRKDPQMLIRQESGLTPWTVCEWYGEKTPSPAGEWTQIPDCLACSLLIILFIYMFYLFYINYLCYVLLGYVGLGLVMLGWVRLGYLFICIIYLFI